MEDWAEVRRLHRAEGMAIKAISRELGISRNAVRRALAASRPPKYERASAGSAVDVFEPAIGELLRQHPRMPASVIGERVGWMRSSSILRARVAELRPFYLPLDPVSRTKYRPGELVQCDLWFPPVDIPLGHGQVGRPPVLVMVCGYSRMMAAVMLPSRQAPDLIVGHWQLLAGLGAVPKALVWDNEAAVGSWRAGKPKLTEDFEAFRGMLGLRVIQCKPRDPEAKGLVERGNGYLETSFLPGRGFDGPDDFNHQLQIWMEEKANQRLHRGLGCRPIERWSSDRAAMAALPPVEPALGWRVDVRLPRDHYVRVDTNDYSVDPAVIGRRVRVQADLQWVRVLVGDRLVAEHRRCWAKHQTLTDPIHTDAAVTLRRRTTQTASWQTAATEVEVRSLSDYDAVFGLEEFTGDRPEAVA
jgi:transposase